MTIQHLTNKINPSALPTNSTQKKGSVNNESQAPKQMADSLAMSTVAKELTKAFELSKHTPVINKERVDAVKKALENKTHPINAEEIAKKMIQMEQDQHDDNRQYYD